MKGINITFNKLSGLARHSIIHTCTGTIELSSISSSLLEFEAELKTVYIVSILGHRIVYHYQDSAAIVLLPLCYSFNHFVHFIYLFLFTRKQEYIFLKKG